MPNIFYELPAVTGLTNAEAAQHMNIEKTTFIKWKTLLGGGQSKRSLNGENILYELFMMKKFKDLLLGCAKWRQVYLMLIEKSKRYRVQPYKLIEEHFLQKHEVNIRKEWTNWKADKMPLVQQLREINREYLKI